MYREGFFISLGRDKGGCVLVVLERLTSLCHSCGGSFFGVMLAVSEPGKAAEEFSPFSCSVDPASGIFPRALPPRFVALPVLLLCSIGYVVLLLLVCFGVE